jgi:hypothetical protein
MPGVQRSLDPEQFASSVPWSSVNKRTTLGMTHAFGSRLEDEKQT